MKSTSHIQLKKLQKAVPQIMTSGSAGGLTQPYKGMVPAAPKRCEDGQITSSDILQILTRDIVAFQRSNNRLTLS